MDTCSNVCGVQLDPMIGPGTSRSYKWWEEAELKYARACACSHASAFASARASIGRTLHMNKIHVPRTTACPARMSGDLPCRPQMPVCSFWVSAHEIRLLHARGVGGLGISCSQLEQRCEEVLTMRQLHTHD